jgi:antitoxin PrlF
MIETTSMSSRGQVVIPVEIREKLGLHEGSKFVVLATEDSVVLKRMDEPSLEEAIREVRKAFAKAGITQQDIHRAIKEVRSEKKR